MGSKNRIAKDILPIILEDRKSGQYFVEPFAGGMNITDKVSGNRIAADKNRFLIAMWKDLVAGREFPTDIPKKFYDFARNDYRKTERTMDDGLIGWVGFMASANGRFFDGGYSGVSQTKIGTSRNYVAEGIRNIEKQIPKMICVEFIESDYRELLIPENSIIYCDIPYQGTKQYDTSKNFNHAEFWEWVRDKSKEGHTVFVSEYNAPNDFIEVWRKEVKSSLSANSDGGGCKASVEKLFTLKNNKVNAT